MKSLTGKALNGIEEKNPTEPAREAIGLLGRLDRLFIKEWKVELIANTKVKRHTPIYYSNYDEAFQGMFKARQSECPELSIEILKEILKGEITDILTALEKYYGVKDTDLSVDKKGTVNRSDERIIRATQFSNWLDSKRSSKKETRQEIENLKQLFKDPNKYAEIMKILANNGLVDEGTGIYKENNSDKSNAVSIIYALRSKGYLINDILLSPEQIILIIKNTFRLDVGKRTVYYGKKLSPLSSEGHKFEIPDAY